MPESDPFIEALNYLGHPTEVTMRGAADLASAGRLGLPAGGGGGGGGSSAGAAGPSGSRGAGRLGATGGARLPRFSGPSQDLGTRGDTGGVSLSDELRSRGMGAGPETGLAGRALGAPEGGAITGTPQEMTIPLNLEELRASGAVEIPGVGTMPRALAEQLGFLTPELAGTGGLLEFGAGAAPTSVGVGEAVRGAGTVTSAGGEQVGEQAAEESLGASLGPYAQYVLPLVQAGLGIAQRAETDTPASEQAGYAALEALGAVLAPATFGFSVPAVMAIESAIPDTSQYRESRGRAGSDLMSRIPDLIERLEMAQSPEEIDALLSGYSGQRTTLDPSTLTFGGGYEAGERFLPGVSQFLQQLVPAERGLMASPDPQARTALQAIRDRGLQDVYRRDLPSTQDPLIAQLIEAEQGRRTAASEAEEQARALREFSTASST